MKLEDLKCLYREWTEDKLLDEYLKKEDYSSVAIQAMEEVLKEKGIFNQAKNKNTEIQQFDEQVLVKKRISFSSRQNYDFAQYHKATNGVYFNRRVMVNHQTNLTGLVLALGIISIICMFVLSMTNMIENSLTFLLLILSIGFVYLWFRLLKKNKFFVELRDVSGETHLEINLGEEKFLLKDSLKYKAYTETIVSYNNGIKVTRFMLYLLVWLKDGRNVLFEEMKGSWSEEKIPEDWLKLNGQDDLIYHDIKLQQHGFNQLELINLKRMMDGLKLNK